MSAQLYFVQISLGTLKRTVLASVGVGMIYFSVSRKVLLLFFNMVEFFKRYPKKRRRFSFFFF